VLNAVNSVVRIEVKYDSGLALGSGFVVHNDKTSTILATNYHVVEGSPRSVMIWLNSGEKVSAKIIVGNAKNDLCLLELNHTVSLPALVLETVNYHQGDAVYAAGFPTAADILYNAEGYNSGEVTITDGIISAIRDTQLIKSAPHVELLQISAAINSGNSGGPLFDKNGKVIGINTYGVNNSQGVFGAISAGELKKMMTDNGITPARSTRIIPYTALGICLFLLLLMGSIIVGKKKKRHKKLRQSPFRCKSVLKKRRKQTLSEYISSFGPMSPNEAVSLLMPVALELKQLHETGNAHLEVSPEHLFITNGHATLSPKSSLESNRYATGFTPPEIYRGINCGIASDIYSFCALLLYSVTGETPPNALTRSEASAITETTKSSAIVGDAAYAQFRAILDRGMSIIAADRFDTMQELIRQLTPFNAALTTDRRYIAPEKSVPSDTAAVKDPSDAGTTSDAHTARKRHSSGHSHRRRRPAVLISVCTAALLTIAVGFYTGCYWGALSLADHGRFTDAKKLIFCERITALHDWKLLRYLEAGIAFENGRYGEAETQFSRLIYDYRNSAEMVDKCIYSRGLLLLDAGNYRSAYRTLSPISEYSDVKDVLATLTGLICTEGEKAYRTGDYWKAVDCFSLIRPNDESELYMTLLNVRRCMGKLSFSSDHDRFLHEMYFRNMPSLSTPEEIVDALMDNFFLEDAAELLVSSNEAMLVFLQGAWYSGNDYIIFDNTNISYCLTWTVLQDNDEVKVNHLQADDQSFLSHSQSSSLLVKINNSHSPCQFEISPSHPDSIEVLCSANGFTYTLQRQ